MSIAQRLRGLPSYPGLDKVMIFNPEVGCGPELPKSGPSNLIPCPATTKYPLRSLAELGDSSSPTYTMAPNNFPRIPSVETEGLFSSSLLRAAWMSSRPDKSSLNPLPIAGARAVSMRLASRWRLRLVPVYSGTGRSGQLRAAALISLG
jgi:hypothetical protein